MPLVFSKADQEVYKKEKKKLLEDEGRTLKEVAVIGVMLKDMTAERLTSRLMGRLV